MCVLTRSTPPRPKVCGAPGPRLPPLGNCAGLESMPVIEQAKGIVMAQQRCGPEEAFDLLRRASQRDNVRVHVLAAQIVAQVASARSETSAQPTPAHLDRARSSGA